MSTNEESHQWYRVSKRDILKSCSSALVPLMIGVMTLVMTIQQNKQVNQNRLNDLQIGKDLREQQLKIDEARRNQDRELSNARREQDQLLDNQRREQDSQLKQYRRQQDLQIAETIRLDFILSTYLNEMSRLLIKYSFTLDENLRQTVARPKTLIALQQLDPKRKTLVFEYLHKSDLIRGQYPSFESSRINMTEANFNNIDLTNTQLTYLSLASSEIINASFQNCDMKVSNFEKAIMKGTSFKGAFLSNSKFFRTSLVNTDFTNADVAFADFTQANLTGSNLTDQQLRTTETYHRAILPNGTIALYENFIQNGDAVDCDLKYWQMEMNDTIEIMYKNESANDCMFRASLNNENVTMSQITDPQKLKAFIYKQSFYVEIKIDIMKIFLSNNLTFVKLIKVFYDKDQLIIGKEEIKIDTTKLKIGEIHTRSWITNATIYLQKTNSIELFINFHYSVVCDNIGLFLEKKRIFFS